MANLCRNLHGIKMYMNALNAHHQSQWWVVNRRSIVKNIDISDMIKQAGSGNIHKHKNMKVGVIAGGIGMDLESGKVTHDIENPTEEVVSNLNEQMQGKGVEFVNGLDELGIKMPPKQNAEKLDKNKQTEAIDEHFIDIDSVDYTIRDE